MTIVLIKRKGVSCCWEHATLHPMIYDRYRTVPQLIQLLRRMIEELT